MRCVFEEGEIDGTSHHFNLIAHCCFLRERAPGSQLHPPPPPSPGNIRILRWVAAATSLSLVAGGANMAAYGNALVPASCSATRCTNATPAGTYVSCPFVGGAATDDGLAATAACLKTPVAIHVERSTGLVVVADAYNRLRAFDGSVASALS